MRFINVLLTYLLTYFGARHAPPPQKSSQIYAYADWGTG